MVKYLFYNYLPLYIQLYKMLFITLYIIILLFKNAVIHFHIICIVHVLEKCLNELTFFSY